MYRKTIEERFEELMTSEEGLSSEEAKRRLEEDGFNQIEDEEPQSVIGHFAMSFMSVASLILLGIAGAYYFLHDIWNAIVILGIVILHSLISTFQYARTKGALEALKDLSTPRAMVMRDGRPVNVRVTELVKGDVVMLEAGSVIPADGRLIETHNLQVVESALTGETAPIDKQVDFMADQNIPLADRLNMVYASSPVSYGRGKFVVTATGMNTEIGKIAFILLKDENKKTPLQLRLDSLSKSLCIIAVFVAAAVFGIGLLQYRLIDEMVFGALALAIAIAPKGLGTVSKSVLALGIKRLSKKNAIIRSQATVETLGCTTVICADKTGTLTQNIMSVTKVAGFADSNEGLIRASALNNDVQLREDGYHLGDPTEVALVNYALSQEMNIEEERGKYPRVGEIPFDASRKLMSTVHQTEDGYIQYVKGGLDEILARSTMIRKGDQTLEMTSQMRYLISEKNEEMASEGLRVLAIAEAKRDQIEQLHERDLTFLGLLGLMDSPRENAKESVRLCRRAGIIPVMITGDHFMTAQAIAMELGIYEADQGHKILTGKELDLLSDQELAAQIEDVRVYAKISPEQKLRIVDAWKSRDHVVAMTDGGVSSTDALRRADIGVAKGQAGSDISRSAADLLIMDDDFSTIVTSVEEGRGIYENVRRTLKYILSCNLGMALLSVVSAALGLAFPLVPVQILWIHLVSSALPALALGVEPSERNAMMRPPRPVSEGIFTKRKVFLTVFDGVLVAGIAFVAYQFGLMQSVDAARTMTFLTIGFSHIAFAFSSRSRGSVFNRNLFANTSFYVSVGLSGVMLFLIGFIPALHPLFRVVPIDAAQWIFIAGLSVIPLLVSEIRKIFIQG